MASAASAGMAALAKGTVRGDLTGATDVADIIFWRSVFILLVASALMRRARLALRPGRPFLLAGRSLAGLLGMAAYFYAVTEIPLGTATTLLYTFPIHTALLAPLLLHEARPRGALTLALLGLGGVALIARPREVGLDLGTGVALGGGFLVALAYIAVRKLRASDPTARIVWWFAAGSLVTAAPFALHDGLPPLGSWPGLAGIGLLAALGQIALTEAYRLERASVIAPLGYTTVVFSYILGASLWGEGLSLPAIAGIALVVGSGVALSRRSGEV